MFNNALMWKLVSIWYWYACNVWKKSAIFWSHLSTTDISKIVQYLSDLTLAHLPYKPKTLSANEKCKGTLMDQLKIFNCLPLTLTAFYKIVFWINYINLNYHIIHIYSGITHGTVFNGKFYAQRLPKLILYQFDLFQDANVSALFVMLKSITTWLRKNCVTTGFIQHMRTVYQYNSTAHKT